MIACALFLNATHAAPFGALNQTVDDAIDEYVDSGGRYQNSFVGFGGIVQDRSQLDGTFALGSVSSGPGVAVRSMSVAAAEGSVFVRGADLEIRYAPASILSVSTRSLFGANFVPAEGFRVAGYGGLGLDFALGQLDDSFGYDDGTFGVGLVLPVLIEVGYALTDNIGVHIRGGAQLGVTGLAFSDRFVDGIASYTPRTLPEGVASLSFGKRQGSRVKGFRIEAGRIQGAWTLMLGTGG